MNKLNPVTWGAFKDALLENPERVLQFQYASSGFVDPSYHITEIKQAPITSVDCGGAMNNWTEVIVQLYEPAIAETGRAMEVQKALSIINRVEKLLPLDRDATVKIEFGNSRFDTRQMYPDEFLLENDTFTVSLVPDFTQCKALGRNESCGIPVPEKSVCTVGSSCCS